jgi:hypothetical protein
MSGKNELVDPIGAQLSYMIIVLVFDVYPSDFYLLGHTWTAHRETIPFQLVASDVVHVLLYCVLANPNSY